jgi:predicted transcriptional regulator
MATKRSEATTAEFNVLKALWRVKQGTVADVKTACATLQGSDPAYTTVMTLLGRLEAKHLVKVDKTRTPFIYKPRHKEASVLRRRLRDFIDSVFEGDASELVLQLVKDEALSADDLARIEAKIAASEDR